MEGSVVIFDADGTLADSLPPHIAFCHAMNEELDAGLQLPADDDIQQCRDLAAAPMDNFLRNAGFCEVDVGRAVERCALSGVNWPIALPLHYALHA